MIRALALFLLVAGITPAGAQSIPVYPGAKLELDDEDACCAFSTADAVEKVIAFYQAKLGAKASTPAVQTPPGVQLRVISAHGENFEIVTARGTTQFSITAERLGREGSQYAFRFRKAKKQLDPADVEYEQFLGETKAADKVVVNMPVYPDSRARGFYTDQTCYGLELITADGLEPVLAFYRAKFPGLQKNENSDGSIVYEWGDAAWLRDTDGRVIKGKSGDLNRLIRLSPGGPDDQLTTIPWFDVESRSYVNKIPKKVTIFIESTRLDDGCSVTK